MRTGDDLQNKPQTVTRENSAALAFPIIVALVIIAAFIALFVWQPWNGPTSSRGNTTVQSGIGGPPAAGNR